MSEGSGVVAAFDCGTNTIKLLIGALPDVSVRESRIVRQVIEPIDCPGPCVELDGGQPRERGADGAA